VRRPLLVAAAQALVVAACTPPPPTGPLPASAFAPAVAFLDSAVAAGAAPGAVLGVSVGGYHFFHSAGRLGIDDSTVPDPGTVYDLASLTKVVGLTTAVMDAVDAGLLDVDAPVQRYVPAFTGPGKERVTLRHLLTHSSGLPAWRALHRESADRAGALALADTTPLDTVPGARFVYSDLGAIVLGQAVETVRGERLDSLLDRTLFGPLGMTSTRFLPPATWVPRIAPTENDPWRGRILRGEVHDENAARLGGVSAHAGLFGSAADLLTFGDWILARSDNERLAPFFHRQDLPDGSSRAFGWDTPSPGSSAGRRLSRRSFGHTGFTGTSIWMDPARRVVIVLLSNRVHPTRENSRWGAVRRGVADRVAAAVPRCRC
jgi:CubicO group peptidase (beta-lactamase class C family)